MSMVYLTKSECHREESHFVSHNGMDQTFLFSQLCTQVWSEEQHLQNLDACQKCRSLSPTPGLLNRNLDFSKVLRFSSLQCEEHRSKVLARHLAMGGFALPWLWLCTVPSLSSSPSSPSLLSLSFSHPVLPVRSCIQILCVMTEQLSSLEPLSHHLGPGGLTFYQPSILSPTFIKYLSNQDPLLIGTLIPATLIKEISPSCYKRYLDFIKTRSFQTDS